MRPQSRFDDTIIYSSITRRQESAGDPAEVWGETHQPVLFPYKDRQATTLQTHSGPIAVGAYCPAMALAAAARSGKSPDSAGYVLR
jgi:hypothetical protein